MDKDKKGIRKNINIIALMNLITSYEDALEHKEFNFQEEEIELTKLIVLEAKEMLEEYRNELVNPVIKRPVWNNP